MDFILISVSILLLSFSFCLWRLGKEQINSFIVRRLVGTEQKDTISLVPKAISVRVKFKKVIPLVLAILLILLLAGIVIGAIIMFSQELVGRGISLIASILISVVIVLILSAVTIFIQINSVCYCRRPLSIDRDEYRVDYDGEVRLPKKVYLGDSQNISIELTRVHMILSDIEEIFSIHGKGNSKFITLQLWQNDALEKFLEVELQAAAFTVDGERKQRHLLNRMNTYKLSYWWNCYYPNSGHHAINLVFRLICSTDTIELGAIQHTIKVVQLDHLTQRQIRIIASIAAIAGFIGTIIGIIINIPTLLQIFHFH
jgi:hypothetical protein